MMEVLANTMVVIILQDANISVQYVVPLKFTQYYFFLMFIFERQSTSGGGTER